MKRLCGAPVLQFSVRDSSGKPTSASWRRGLAADSPTLTYEVTSGERPDEKKIDASTPSKKSGAGRLSMTGGKKNKNTIVQCQKCQVGFM